MSVGLLMMLGQMNSPAPNRQRATRAIHGFLVSDRKGSRATSPFRWDGAGGVMVVGGSTVTRSVK